MTGPAGGGGAGGGVDDRAVPEPADEGGDPPCWAHLFDDGPDDSACDGHPAEDPGPA